MADDTRSAGAVALRHRGRQQRSPLGALAGCAAAVVIWFAGVPAVSGHALILESSPRHEETVAAPKRLVLRFNSRIEKKLCSVSLTGPGQTTILLLKQELDAPPNTLIYQLPVLRPGAYRVKWTVLATDGHVTEGRLAFSVTDGAP